MQSEHESASAFEIGQRAWPQVRLRPEPFAAFVGSLGLSHDTLLVRASDLFLACSCAAGDEEAVRQLDCEFLSQLDRYVARFTRNLHTSEEIRQRIRIKLLVGPKPGIASYRGNGPLAAWLRVTSVRTAIDVVGRTSAVVSAEISLLDLGAGFTDNPEILAARNLYRERFKDAVEKGIGALPAREKTILRFSVIDGLNIAAIGTIYQVHRATVARWLVAIRARVLASVRQKLGLRSEPSLSEMRSLVTLLYNDIHISAERILSTDPEHSASPSLPDASIPGNQILSELADRCSGVQDLPARGARGDDEAS